MSAIAVIAACYVLGSLPTAVWIGRFRGGVDVREHGSGNPGATNVLRVLGRGRRFAPPLSIGRRFCGKQNINHIRLCFLPRLEV